MFVRQIGYRIDQEGSKMADANLGANLISAMGAGSFDVTAMVNGLAESERAPKVASFDSKQESYQATLDAYTSVKEAMSGFKGLLAEINDLQKLQSRTVTSSKESVFTATANKTGTLASPGSYEVEVTSLAKAHSVYSGAFTSTSDVIGTGSLTFRFGSTNYDAGTDTYSGFANDPQQTGMTVTVDSSNNTLIGLRDSINVQNKGVKANIVNDGTGYRLVFSSTSTGANHSMEVVASDSDGNHTDSSGLSKFTFNSTSTNMAQSSAASNAVAKVDGLTVTSQTNDVSGVIEGVTLNLKSTSVGTKHSVTIAHDKDTVKTAITNFVGDYNALMTVFEEYGKYSDGNAGALQSDSLTRSMMSDIKSGVSVAMSLLPTGFKTLADIGVNKDRYGKMVLDSKKLDTAMKNDFDSVSRLFTKSGASSNTLTSFVSADKYTKVGAYTVTVTTAGQEATKGSYSGSTNSYLSGTVKIDSKNDYFKVKVDGVQNTGTQSGRVYLTQKTYTNAEELAVEIQNKINSDSAFTTAGSSVTVKVDRTETNPKFVITSNKTGSSSKVEFTGVNTDTVSELGISVKSGSTGLDKVDVVASVKGQNESAAWTVAGSGFRITSAMGDSRGLVFDTRSAKNSSFTVNYTEGVASKLDGILEGVLKKKSTLDTRMTNLSTQIKEIEEDRTKLDERIARKEDAWRRQFNALNTLMGKMQSTGTFLENTFKSMNGSND
jgi:flagellar hook-associated protein 2